MYDESFMQAEEEDRSLSKRSTTGRTAPWCPLDVRDFDRKTFGAVTYRPTTSINPPTKKEKRENRAGGRGPATMRPTSVGEEEREEGEIEGEEVEPTGIHHHQQPHPLGYEWTFWYDNPSAKSRQDPKSNLAAWGSSICPVHTFSTVEDFWRVLCCVLHKMISTQRSSTTPTSPATSRTCIGIAMPSCSTHSR